MKFYEKIECMKCGGTGSISRVSPAELRRRRIASGMSLRAVAKKLDLSPMFISEVERGTRNPNMGIIAFYQKLESK